MTTDWADEKAREWLKKEGVKLSGYSCVLEDNPWVECDEQAHASLAALLREVQEQEQERIKGIVVDVEKSIWGAPRDTGSAVTFCCDEILRRIEGLK